MAIEGDLSDISLPTMAQMICIERRDFALLMHRGAEEGQVHFQRGEIVHAVLGELQGTEAMYQLLTWSNGTFRMMSEKAPPAKTIDMHWNQLLLEGLRKLDESRRDQAGESREEEGAPADKALDFRFESDLVRLLRTLNQEIADLANRGLRREAEVGLATLERIVNAVVSFAELEVGPDLGDASLAKELAAAVNQVPEARLLKVHNNRLSTLTIVHLFKSWDNDPADRARTMRQVCRACTLLLERYFTLLGRRFQGGPAGGRWNERTVIFLSHLQRVVARIDL